jgi:GNAT superfamily N-acetyltransferase
LFEVEIIPNMLLIVRTETAHADFEILVAGLNKELWERYPDIQAQYVPHNKVENIRTAVIVYDENKPVGCGCSRPVDNATTEIKRMYVLPDYRGQGIAAMVIAELEKWAKEQSYARTVLELGDCQPEALQLYRKSGYKVIENYGPYIGMNRSICMEKKLN